MISEKTADVKKRIEAAVSRRSPEVNASIVAEIQPFLLLVSKRQPLEKVKEAVSVGMHHFAENYLQSLQNRRHSIPQDDISFHLIGRVQTNKISKAIVAADWIHSVNSLSTVIKFQRRIEQIDSHSKDARSHTDGEDAPATTTAAIETRSPDGTRPHSGDHTRPILLLQIDPSDQSDKGMDETEFKQVLEHLKKHPTLKQWFKGVMTIAPFTDNEKILRRHFKACRLWLERFNEVNPEAKYFSAGMSADFEIAVEEGANIVRVGTAVFGPRPDNPTPRTP